MLDTRDKTMGRFCVTVELANNGDIELVRAGHLSPDKVRRVAARGWVDTGAARLVLPESVVRELCLPIVGETAVRYAGGQTARRPIAESVRLTCGGRSSVFSAVVEPDRDSALIGAIVLEELDLIPDCTLQKLVPRDPERIISEIE